MSVIDTVVLQSIPAITRVFGMILERKLTWDGVILSCTSFAAPFITNGLTQRILSTKLEDMMYRSIIILETVIIAVSSAMRLRACEGYVESVDIRTGIEGMPEVRIPTGKQSRTIAMRCAGAMMLTAAMLDQDRAHTLRIVREVMMLPDRYNE